MKIAQLISFATAAFASVSAATAIPQPNLSPGRCTGMHVRKEWRSLNNNQKTNFINAVKCLMNSPATDLTSIIPSVQTRFEDFLAEHQRTTPNIHYGGYFLPWHRLFLAEFERALRTECFYVGSLPYWDWTLDTANVAASPVFTGTVNFGGNGAEDPTIPHFFNSTAGGCIMAGPFANETIHISAGSGAITPTTRCIRRDIVTIPGLVWLNAGRQAAVLAQPNYAAMALMLEGGDDFYVDLGMHSAGHLSVGGDMTDAYSSPSDPLFYLHHANIDRIWNKWQRLNPANLFAIGGSSTPTRTPGQAYTTFPAGPDMTLDYPVNIGTLGGTRYAGITTAHVMDIAGTTPEGYTTGVLCYNYEN